MQQGRASQTAAWVATARSLGSLLPEELLLARDPYGVRFASPRLSALAAWLMRVPRVSRRLLLGLGPLTDLVLWMQLRTRTLDDLTRDYLAQGGQQIVLLGAGFDCRALRFEHERERAGAKVYEIDYPATQHHKRSVLAEHTAHDTLYVAWDFERDALDGLSAKLTALGLDTHARTLTIWEGVTMYLSEPAIDASVRAVRDLGGEGSLLAFNYIDRRMLEAPALGLKAVTEVVKRAGEPYQFGWDTSALAPWLFARGFVLIHDDSEHELALRYWPHQRPRPSKRAGRRIALARRMA